MPTASNRTRSASKTGPSTQERTIRTCSSAPRTGSTHVMQTPTPQAIVSSTATWQTTPCACATRATAASIGIGPQA